MDESIKRRLMEGFEKGELVPMTRIPLLQQIPASTVCRMARAGKFPHLRVGKLMLTSQQIIRESLESAAVVGEPAQANGTPKTKPATHKATRAAQIGLAKEKLRRRGLPV